MARNAAQPGEPVNVDRYREQLERILDDPNSPPQAKVNACDTLLRHCVRVPEGMAELSGKDLAKRLTDAWRGGIAKIPDENEARLRLKEAFFNSRSDKIQFHIDKEYW